MNGQYIYYFDAGLAVIGLLVVYYFLLDMGDDE